MLGAARKRLCSCPTSRRGASRKQGSRQSATPLPSSLPETPPLSAAGWPPASSGRTHSVLWTPPVLAWLSTWVKALGRSMPAAPRPGLPRQPPSRLPRASAGTSPSSRPLRNAARPGGPGPALGWRRNTALPREAPGVVVPCGLAAHPGKCSSSFPGEPCGCWGKKSGSEGTGAGLEGRLTTHSPTPRHPGREESARPLDSPRPITEKRNPCICQAHVWLLSRAIAYVMHDRVR